MCPIFIKRMSGGIMEYPWVDLIVVKCHVELVG